MEHVSDSTVERAGRWFKGLGRRTQLVLGQGTPLGLVSQILAEHYADRPAFEVDASFPGFVARDVWTYTDVERAVARLAAASQDFSFFSQRRILIAIGNRMDTLMHIFALARVGAIPVPINPRLKHEEFEAVVKASQATGIIADGDVFRRWSTSAVIEELERCWSGADEAPDDDLCHDLVGWLESYPEEKRETCASSSLTDTALLLATSGTTGHPKAAALTSRGLLGGIGWLMALPVGLQSGLRAQRDVMMAALPLTHVMGLSTALAALCAGVTYVHVQRFRAKEMLERLVSRRPNVFIGVPTMYADLEAEGIAQRDVSCVQLWVSAADAMPPDRARRFQSYGAAGLLLGRAVGLAGFADIYGMVELSGPMALRWYALSPFAQTPLPSICFALPGFEVRAVDEHGHVLGFGKQGELQVRGGGVLRRYEGARGTGPDEDGWFATGDIATVWAAGFFSIEGRSRDRLKVGGFSVFPAEVETTLRKHPAVKEVALVGLPDERLGDKPVALVVPEDEPFPSEDFLAWAAEHIAGYRKPHQVFLSENIPRGNHGKIDRQAATLLVQDLLEKMS